MALEKDVIVNKLKDEGIDENLCNGLHFETEDELTSWVDTYKSGLPVQNKALNEYTKEELEEIAKDPQFKGAKGLQGLLDSIRQRKSDPKPSDPKPSDPKPTDEPPEWAKQLIEDTKKLKEQNAAKEFDSLVQKTAKAEGLSEVHINRLKKGLKADATEADIKSEITSYKREMADLGIKEFGYPGGGSGGNSSSGKKLAEQWRDKHKKNKK